MLSTSQQLLLQMYIAWHMLLSRRGGGVGFHLQSCKSAGHFYLMEAGTLSCSGFKYLSFR